MTNREKWMSEVISDRIFEESTCRKFNDPTTTFGNCPKCPIRVLCKMRFADGVLTDSEYMEAVSEWLDKEDKDD